MCVVVSIPQHFMIVVVANLYAALLFWALHWYDGNNDDGFISGYTIIKGPIVYIYGNQCCAVMIKQGMDIVINRNDLTSMLMTTTPTRKATQI